MRLVAEIKERKQNDTMIRKRLIYTTLLVVSVLTVLTALGWYAIFNKPHRSVKGEDAIRVTAVQLFDAYEANESEANKKYLDRAVEVTGKITEITTDMERKPVVVFDSGDIMFGVRCTLDESSGGLQAGMTVTIKGICKGYLSDVVITDAFVTN